MGWWSKLTGTDESPVAEIERQTELVHKLGNINRPAIDKFDKDTRESIKLIRDYLRKNGNTLPTDMYSRANGILDFVVRFLSEYITEHGLSAEQEAHLEMALNTRLPEIVRLYLDIPEAQRTKEDAEKATDGLVGVQTTLVGIRDLAMRGSLSASVRMDSYINHVVSEVERNNQPGKREELFS